MFVPFYEPMTSIGRIEKSRGTHDYGLQLVRRGFVTLALLLTLLTIRVGL